MSLSLALLAAPSLAQILHTPDLRGALVGAVVAAPDGRSLFAEGADLRLMPASNEKLFTVAFALDTLGPSYRSATHFWRDEESIAIDSDGTLDLSYAKLSEFATKFGRRPKVVLWQAFRPGRPDSWQLGDAPNRYAPTIAAFSCERAGVELWCNPAGDPEIRPAPLGVTLSTNWRGSTEARPIARGLRFDPSLGVVYSPGEFSGQPGRVDTLSQPAPDLAAAGLFGDKVERSTADPALIRRRTPDATLLADPLEAVAGRCLKPSDNFLAEHLLMMAARNRLGRDVDFGTASRAIADWARVRVGLPERTFDPADGSGLSRKNLVTARSLARLLNWSRKQRWGKVYTDAMADPNSGTLKGRLKGVRFRGKTGTLDGACALSGLVKTKSGRELAVSLIVNHYACSTARVRTIQDEFVKRVAASY